MNVTQPLESPSSMTALVPHQYQNAKVADNNHSNDSEMNDNSSKRISDCGYPATAIKVDLPYQSYLNHPFTKLQQPNQQQLQSQQQPHSQVQKPQAFINKYNSYTNSSKSIRLITIPSTSSALSSIEKSKMNNHHNGLMSGLDSPTSPMVSPPPPYLHSDQGDVGRFNGLDSKKQHGHHQQQPQWPSMMMLSSAAGVTTTTATVTRPKLARVLPPQAIPIVTSGPGFVGNHNGRVVCGSGAEASPLTAASSNPRASRLMMMTDNVQMLDESLSTTTHAASTAVMEQQMSLRATSSSCFSSSYPGFWKEARQSKMHYVLLSFGLVMMGSGIWVLAMQVFLLEWAMVMPAASLVLFGMQYGRYRWKRNKHYRQIKKNGEASASSAVAAAAAAAAQLSSLASSSSPRESDAYLEPHQPHSFYAIPVPQQHHHVTFQEHPQQQQQQQYQFNQQSYKQPRTSQPSKKHHQNRPSAPPSLSTSSSLTSLSSSSPSSGPSSPVGHRRPTITPPSAIVNNGSPFYQNHQFLSPVESPMTPPPAYFLKKIELPEIGSVVGDLVSEFEIDFSSIKY
ncbi:hypothetical protein BGZ83_009865 [Gryganskiella cystojenkinii]|nr:hypothetical protein BGZ83_009865 [Gryganskiella cystojenkinii]